VDRPRLLLVPEFTELEWDAIRPRLEEWAEVASFDAPGVGDEPRTEKLDRGAIVERGLEELDRLGWEACFVATDSWGIATALRLAHARPDAVMGMALGHAKLSYRREGERAPINGPIFDALAELIRTDHVAFIRHGIVQATGGSVREDLAERMIERVPHDLLVSGWEVITREDDELGDLLRQVDCPLLFAQHVGCLGSTEEGFEDAAAAFPEARTVAVEDAPLTSGKFADAIRDFCEEILAAAREKSGRPT
jgi:pimeloyl-ACP methyl ester carboxylesterase